jgi:branched-subunit amino acid transport protein
VWIRRGDFVNIEKIITSIVAGILPLISKRVLIFISGGTVNAEILLNTLSDSELISYDVVLTDAARKMIDEESIKKLKGNVVDCIDELDKAIIDSSFVIIPVMTRNTLSKIALGIADNLLTTGISRAIMMNKEILAVRDSYDPQNPVNISNGLSNNDVYHSMFLNYEKTVNDFGVKIIDSSEFESSMQNEFDKSLSQPAEKRKRADKNVRKVEIKENRKVFESCILTLTDIKRTQNYDVIVIEKGTLITPSAKDYIYSNKIKVEYKG